MTKVLIDADSCPVKELIINIAKKYNYEVVMFTDTSHIFKKKYNSTIITVDKGADSVDIKLINYANKEDIIVTGDYGVASMGLGKSCYCINNNGMIYTDYNIDTLLHERYISAKMRRAGQKTSNIPKRTIQNDKDFESNFITLCEKAKKNSSY